ncbi:MAG: site-specific integrase [Acidimicrobiales bacterium]
MTYVAQPSPAGLEALAREVATALGVSPAELPDRLAYLIEAPPLRWLTAFGRDPRLATQVSALLALSGAPGLVRPRLFGCYQDTACYLHLRHELVVRFPEERVPALEGVLQRLFACIPRPLDLYEARRVLGVAFEGRPPSSLMSLLAALGIPELLRVEDQELDAVAAARTVREESGTAFAEALVASGVLHPVMLQWVAERRARFGAKAGLEPVRVLAGLPAEAGAMLVYGAAHRPARWESTTPVVSHLARLARVLGLEGPPTMSPRRELLAHVVLDEEGGAAYDQGLLDDARERAEELVEDEDCGEERAKDRAARWAMRGFGPFVGYLERLRALGAPISVVPKGIALPRRGVTRWQGIREDLCPRPEQSLELLALAPELLADEPDGHLVLLQLLSAARASVVLSLRPSYVVAVDEGVVIHVPWQASKTGTGLLFVPRSFVELMGFEASWLDPHAPVDPPQWRRDELAGVIERLCRRVEDRTGAAVPHRSVRFSRTALAQLYARHLHGLDRETVTALLGHRLRQTRANYLRAWPEELMDAYRRWRAA